MSITGKFTVVFPPGLDYETAPSYNVTLQVLDGAGGHSISLEFTVDVENEAVERPTLLDLPASVSITEDNFTQPQLMWEFNVAVNDDPNLSFWFEVEPDNDNFYLYPVGGRHDTYMIDLTLKT